LRLLQRRRFAATKVRFALEALAADLDPRRIRASNAPRLGASGRCYQKTVD